MLLPGQGRPVAALNCFFLSLVQMDPSKVIPAAKLPEAPAAGRVGTGLRTAD